MTENEKDKLIIELYKCISEQKQMIEMLIKQNPKYNKK